MLQNSQCNLYLGQSSTSSSGNTLTVNVAIAFNPSFSGAKSIWGWVLNNAGAVSDWQQVGTWTVTSGPSVVGVTPNTGTGPQQTFSFQYWDGAGVSDILAAQGMIS